MKSINPTENNLKVFGFGLALIIPYLVAVKTAHLQLNALNLFLIIVGFVLLLMLLNKVEAYKFAYYTTLVSIYIFTAYLIRTHGFGPIRSFLLAGSFICLLITLVHVDWLKPIYTYWMKAAMLISTLMTALIMIIMFYGIFTPMGIFFRIIKKDFLDRRLQPEVKSYWRIREQVPFDKSRCERQF